MADPRVTVISRERRDIRTREARVTQPAWRVELELPSGERGAIVQAEPFFRGEGALMGAGQERLAELWRASQPDAPAREANPVSPN